MADITLHKDDNATTTIDNRFIDQYMTEANGEFVKIYLYLLRCMNSPDCSFSISRAADKFNHTEKDIQRALKYWEKMNLLQLEYAQDNSIAGIYFLESEAAAVREDDSVPLKKTAAPVRKTARTADELTAAPVRRTAYTADELKAFREKEEVQELMFVAESYLARPLTSTDIQKLLFWYDGLSFSVDLIVYLMEYCIAGGHSSLHYMDKVALNWKEEQIKTVEQAKRSSQTHSQLHYAVLKALGIQGRSLIPAEFAFISKWSKEYGFGQDMITEACSRTILAIHQPSFEYTDRILTSWKRQNIKTPNDIHKADEAYQAAKAAERTRTVSSRTMTGKSFASNRFNSFPQRTYNMEQLEAKLLNTTS
ncbi:DnaD domain protein [Lachnospiraceae bacterium]|nr:DnaD domain protein [Lachnospiraceae bacterium]